jgi:MFS family permease
MAAMSLRDYRTILHTPQVPRLILTAGLGRLSVSMTGLALVLLVRNAAGSYALAGLVAGAFALGSGVAAPLLGRIADRKGQTRLLLACGAVCTAAFTGIAVVAQVGPRALLPVIAAVAGASLPPIGACMRVLWSVLLGRGSALQAAFAFEATALELNFIVGPLLVVGLIAAASPTVAVLAIAATVLVGTSLFAATPASRAWRPDPARRDWAGALRGPGVRTVVGVTALVSISFGVIEVSVPAVAEQLGNRTLSGMFLSLWAGGSMLGGLIAGALTTSRPPERLVVVRLGLLALGLGPLAAAVTGVLPFAACMTLAGLGIAPATACLFVLLERSAPAGAATEAFTWVTSAITAGFALGNAFGGSIVQHAGPRTSFLLALVAVSAASLLARARRASLAAPRSPALEPETA